MRSRWNIGISFLYDSSSSSRSSRSFLFRLVPAAPTLRIDLTLPILRIDPALPILRIEPVLPMLRIEPALPMLRMLTKLSSYRR